VGDFQRAIRVVQNARPGEDVIGKQPPGNIKDAYKKMFKGNMRKVLKQYPDLAGDPRFVQGAARSEAEKLTNDYFVPKMRQMAEKGRGLTPPPTSMMAGDKGSTSSGFGMRESANRRISKRQLQQIVKEELTNVLKQKKKVSKQRRLTEALTGKQINAMHRAGKFGKYLGDPMEVTKGPARKVWLNARRALARKDVAGAQQIVQQAIASSADTLKKAIAKPAGEVGSEARYQQLQKAQKAAGLESGTRAGEKISDMKAGKEGTQTKKLTILSQQLKANPTLDFRNQLPPDLKPGYEKIYQAAKTAQLEKYKDYLDRPGFKDKLRKSIAVYVNNQYLKSELPRHMKAAAASAAPEQKPVPKKAAAPVPSLESPI